MVASSEFSMKEEKEFIRREYLPIGEELVKICRKIVALMLQFLAGGNLDNPSFEDMGRAIDSLYQVL